MTHWTDHAIFWHVYPLGFVGAARADGATAAPTPRLRRLTGWLDHVIELGANGLLLGPVFASHTHGYDTIDHFRVDPRLGTEDDLRTLIDDCHARGIRVVLDGVFNHVGRGFAPFVDVDQRGEQSGYAGWFRRTGDGGFATFEGHDQLVALDHREPAVVDYVTSVMTHWLDRGVDGWRLDAAYAVPTGFWQEVTGRVRAAHPHAWLLGEVIHGDYAAFVEASGVDSVTQYELWKATWSALNDGNFFELAWALERHQRFLATFVPQTFLGNHDVTRIASQLSDRRHVPHALVVLLTVAGVPSIYTGDELGLTGVKEHREGGDDAVRPEFPGAPSELTGDGEVHRLHQELIAVRRRNPWLVQARTQVDHLANHQLLYRSTAADRTVLVALNLDAAPATLELPPGRWTLGAGHAEVGDRSVALAGNGWTVLETMV